MSKELIRLVDCCMAFDDELVLDHLNLTIDDSEFLTLLGSSGCGKNDDAAYYRRLPDTHIRRGVFRWRRDHACTAP